MKIANCNCTVTVIGGRLSPSLNLTLTLNATVTQVHYMYLIDDLKKAQKRATKILRQCKHLHYWQRLEFLNLPTLAFRRNGGDMREVYKIYARQESVIFTFRHSHRE